MYELNNKPHEDSIRNNLASGRDRLNRRYIANMYILTIHYENTLTHTHRQMYLEKKNKCEVIDSEGESNQNNKNTETRKILLHDSHAQFWTSNKKNVVK